MTCPWLSRSGGKPPSRLALPMVFYSLSCRRDVICVNFSAFLQFVALCTFCPNKNELASDQTAWANASALCRSDRHHGARRCYSLGGHTLVVAGRPSGTALTTRRLTVPTQCQRPCPLHATAATTTLATRIMMTTVEIFSMTLSGLEISAR